MKKLHIISLVIIGSLAASSCSFAAVPVYPLWTTDGITVCASAYNQFIPKVVSAGNGKVIVTWQDYRNGIPNVYSQKINQYGTPEWAGGVAVCTAAVGQGLIQIASDGYGGAIIAWVDMRTGGNYKIYAQRVSSSGIPLWTANGVAVCSNTAIQGNVNLATDAAGNAFITWVDSRAALYAEDIYAQKIDQYGTPQWTTSGVAVCTDSGDQSSPQIVGDGLGGAIVAWQDIRSGTNNIYAQKVNSGGTTAWTANGVAVCPVASGQFYPKITDDGANNAIVAWLDARNGIYYNVYAQKLANSNGGLLWTTPGVAVCTDTHGQIDQQMVSDGTGGAIISWRDNRNGTPSLYAQRLNTTNGGGVWTANGTAVCPFASSQLDARLASDGNGSAIFVWEDSRNGGTNTEIYAQKVNAVGTLVWTDSGVPVCTAVNEQTSPQIAYDGSGGAIFVWEDSRKSPTGTYAQRLSEQLSAGLLPTVYVSLAGNDATGEGTSTKPFRTINYGLTRVATGGVVNVLAGTYAEHDLVWPARTNICMIGAGSNETIISAAGLGRVISIETAVNLTIEALTIKGGRVTGNGGGVYIGAPSKMWLRNVNMLGCTAEGAEAVNGFGGAFYSANSCVFAYDCSFVGNSAIWGGVKCLGTLEASNCLFKDNQADYGGVGRYGFFIMKNCRFLGNKATSYGGVVYNSPIVDLVNCVFKGNTAGISGGVNSGSHGKAVNCTFYGNSAAQGGVLFSAYFKSVNCIFWGNTATTSDPVSYSMYLATFEYSDMQPDGSITGKGNISANPLFLSTDEFNPIFMKLDFASPCINAGTFEGAPAAAIDGTPRPQPANSQKLYYDMGVHEQAGALHLAAENLLPTVYVSPAGNDATGEGTSAEPFRTVTYGLTRVATGGVVNVLAGTYLEQDIIWPKRNHIRLVGAGSNETIISASGLGRVISIESTVSLTIEALTIRNGRITGEGAGIYVAANTIPDLRLRNMNIIGCTAEGTEPTNGFGGAVFGGGHIFADNCSFIGNSAIRGGVMYHGYWDTNNCLFKDNKAYYGGVARENIFYSYNCRFIDNKADLFGGVTYNCSRVIFTDCILKGNSAGTSGGVDSGSASGSGAVNCTFYGNSAAQGGVMSSANFKSVNCIFWGNTATASDPVVYPVAYNVYLASFKYSDIQPDGFVAGTGNISAEPQFVSISEPYDFNLLATSPCIDAGTFEGTPVSDILGNSRLQGVGSRPDMGAYEFMGAAATSKPSAVVPSRPRNIPNPFKTGTGTTIIYTLTSDSNIKLIIYDITGKSVATKYFSGGGNGARSGENRVFWDGYTDFGKPAPNGVYIYVITSGTKVLAKGQMAIMD